MAQIQKGDTFADGELVTAARLNALLDSAILNTNAITDQGLITTGSVNDTLLVYQASSATLKKITFDDLIGISTGGGLGVLTVTQIFGNTGLSIATGAGNVTVAGYNNTDIGNASSSSGSTNIYSYNDINIDCSIGKVVVACTTNFTTTGAIKIPVGTTAQRPATLATGQFRYNSTIGTAEFYNGSSWVSPNPLVKSAVLTQVIPDNTNYVYPVLNAWTNLPLNTLTETDTFVLNAASFTGSGTSQTDISLPAGTYSIATSTSMQAGGGSGGIVARVYNSTTGTALGTGFVSFCDNYSHGTSICYAVFKLTATSIINIQYFASANGNSNAIIGNTPEVLFPTMITKLA